MVEAMRRRRSVKFELGGGRLAACAREALEQALEAGHAFAEVGKVAAHRVLAGKDNGGERDGGSDDGQDLWRHGVALLRWAIARCAELYAKWGDEWAGSKDIRASDFVGLALGFALIAASGGTVAQGAVDGGCPRAALKEMMAAAAEYGGIGDVAVIELEVLKLCVERQELIGEIVDNERELAGLRGESRGRTVEVSEMPALVVPDESLPLPVKVGDAGGELVVVEVEKSRPRLRWMTMYGSAGDWVAGVSDGVRIWYVRAGDRLPSGVKVLSVRLRPAGVSVGLNGERWLIPGPSGGS